MEPHRRGTATCIGLAAKLIEARDAEATMIVLPADHLIKDCDAFVEILRSAIATAADTAHLITLGVRPRGPETGYGYIHARREWAASSSRVGALHVEAFIEKPDLPLAETYVRDGAYYWNSGVFAWRADAILSEMERFMPRLSNALDSLSEHIGRKEFAAEACRAYLGLDTQSVDRGIMEKSDRVLLIPMDDIGWSDIGGWEELRRALEHVERPWGHEYLWALNQHYAAKLLNIRIGESLTAQCHKEKDETLCVISGQLRLLLGSVATSLEERILTAGARVSIPPGTVHRLEAIETSVVIEVSTAQIADVVRFRDCHEMMTGREQPLLQEENAQHA